MKRLAPLATAFVGILATWASWTYSLRKRDSKRESIRDALAKGRLICHCSDSGEIMTHHHTLPQSVNVYACPVCEHIEVISHPGIFVPISEATEFRPPLPTVARQQWILRSNDQRE